MSDKEESSLLVRHVSLILQGKTRKKNYVKIYYHTKQSFTGIVYQASWSSWSLWSWWWSSLHPLLIVWCIHHPDFYPLEISLIPIE